MRHPVYMETKMALYTGYQILAYLHAFIYLVNCKCKHNVLLKMPYNHIRQLVCVVKEYNYIVYALALILLAMAEGRISGHKCYSHRANADEKPLYQYPFTKINSSLFLDTPKMFVFECFYGFSALHILWQRIHTDPDA